MMQPCLDDLHLQAMLAEDAPFGDLTTRALGIEAVHGQMRMHARGAMRLCGSEEAARLVELAGGRILRRLDSGVDAGPGDEILQAVGPAGALHLAWKTAQALIEHLSGVASCAAEIVHELRAAGFALPLACTRKNLPGSRLIMAKAVLSGGAVAHRLGLSETLLVFPEHRVFLAEAGLAERLAAIRRQYPEKKLVAEVGSIEEALRLAECGAEILQLERFTPEALSECRQVLAAQGLRVLLAPAGGVTRENALAYARAGADFLVSSAPYFAAPRDVKVSFVRA